jgi:leader peptidase (prepilin peptidase)/N-methyltransferase
VTETPQVAEGPATENEEEEDDWEPGPTSIPFGPWLSLAALEVMLLGPLLREVLPVPLDMLFAGAR